MRKIQLNSTVLEELSKLNPEQRRILALKLKNGWVKYVQEQGIIDGAAAFLADKFEQESLEPYADFVESLDIADGTPAADEGG